MYRSLSLPIALLLAGLAGCLPATRRFPEASPGGAAGAAAAQRLENAYSSPRLSHDRRTVLQAAESWLGTPYAFGGNTRSGVDCSGFVRSVYEAAGRRLPRSSAQQAGVGESITLSESLPGDLVFFNTNGTGVSHVGILVDRYSFVHASTSAGVIVSGLDETYYSSRIVGVRRVLGDERVSRVP